MIFSSKPTISISSYSDIRPHHILALYSSYHILSSILSSNRFLSKLQNHLSNHVTTILSKLSDYCLPLLYYSPYTSMLLPDFVIRYAIRVRCKHTLIELGEKGAERDQLGKMMIVNELKTMPIAIGKCIIYYCLSLYIF